jgi:hypothetical protein
VGRTFLKHTTTAMMQLKFDKAGSRFVVFTKNRRAGSMTHVPIYFSIGVPEGGDEKEVMFDEAAFNNMRSAGQISENATDRQAKLRERFADVFDAAKRIEPGKDDEEELTFGEEDER